MLYCEIYKFYRSTIVRGFEEDKLMMARLQEVVKCDLTTGATLFLKCLEEVLRHGLTVSESNHRKVVQRDDVLLVLHLVFDGDMEWDIGRKMF